MLAFQVVPATAQCRGVLVACHGIFGMGTNLRTYAQRLTQTVPGLGVVLVDLRGHGGSLGLAAPHTLLAAAGDVLEVIGAINAGDSAFASLGSAQVGAVLGHSFGGKVSLTLSTWMGTACPRLLIVDASPSARPGDLPIETATQVLELLERLPAPLPSRAFFEATLAEAGYAKPLIAWLGMNVKLSDGALHLRLDLPAIRALLTDYYATDLWSVVESEQGPLISLILGAQSTHYSVEDRARAERATYNPRVQLRRVADAGHWVHVDNLDGLVAATSPDLAIVIKPGTLPTS